MTKKEMRAKLLEAAKAGIAVYSQTYEGRDSQVEFRQGNTLIRVGTDRQIVYFEIIVKEVQ